MNSGNPVEDATNHFNQIEWEEKHKVQITAKCDFCKKRFTSGLEFEFEKACDECCENETVRAKFKENGMGDGLINTLFIHANKIDL